MTAKNENTLFISPYLPISLHFKNNHHRAVLTHGASSIQSIQWSSIQHSNALYLPSAFFVELLDRLLVHLPGLRHSVPPFHLQVTRSKQQVTSNKQQVTATSSPEQKIKIKPSDLVCRRSHGWAEWQWQWQWQLGVKERTINKAALFLFFFRGI